MWCRETDLRYDARARAHLALPDLNTLQNLIIRCNLKQPFTDDERVMVRNVLIAQSQDALYLLRERMKKYEAEEPKEYA